MTIAILIDIPNDFTKETKYTIENIFFPYIDKTIYLNDVSALKNYTIKIIYCYENSPLINDVTIFFKDSILIILEEKTIEYFNSFKPYDYKNIQWNGKIPQLFPLRTTIRGQSAECIFPFDIIAASFFFLSCWQEYTSSERDEKGRIPLKNTLQHRLGIIRLPIVNQYLRQLNDAIQKLWGIKLTPKPMPRSGDAYVALSHDIDHIDWSFNKYLFRLFNDRKKIRLSKADVTILLRNFFGKKYIFDKIKSIELKNGATSSFFFLSNYKVRKHQRYSENLIRSLNGTDFEVGHHISHRSIFEKTLDDDYKEFRVRHVRWRCSRPGGRRSGRS